MQSLELDNVKEARGKEGKRGQILMRDQNDIEKLIQLTFDVGMAIHKDVGPGLMESVYENVLADRLQKYNVKIDRQQQVNVDIYGV